MPLEASDGARLRDVVSFGKKVTFFAVCYGIQVVGEAAWKMSEEFKKSHSAIPWPLIASMRHRLVHDYGRTDETIVYEVATIHLPLLIEQAQAILDREGPTPTRSSPAASTSRRTPRG